MRRGMPKKTPPRVGAGGGFGIGDLPEQNEMLSSITDLLDDVDANNNNDSSSFAANNSYSKISPSGSGNYPPPAGTGGDAKCNVIISGFTQVQQDFTESLGENWFDRTASDDSSSSGDLSFAASHCMTALSTMESDIGDSQASTTAPYNQSTSSNNNNNTNNSGSSPTKTTAAAMPPLHPNTVHHPPPQHHGGENCSAADTALAQHLQSIIQSLDRLPRTQLLAYAARLSVLAGNFLKLSKEGRLSQMSSLAAGMSPKGSSLPNALTNANLSNAGIGGSGRLSGGSDAHDQALIDWATSSRPISSMTTFSDFGSLQFSASTASIAGMLPATDTGTAHVEGDIEEGTKTLNDYVVVAPIGSGSFGTVELGVTLAGEPRAIKAVKRSALMGRNENMIRREIALMKKLKHDNVARLYEVIDDPGSNVIYLVMKYCQNGPIVKVRSDFTCDTIPLTVAKGLLRQLISGLHYLHLRRIVHRDIKPDNILLDHANVPCFVDFGVSGTVHKKSRTAVTEGVEGTPVFWAPELFARKKSSESSSSGSSSQQQQHKHHHHQHDTPAPPPPVVDLMAADVYGLGATFYLAVCGIAPFVGKTLEELGEHILNDQLKLPSHLPPAWKDLFRKMMDKDPVTRAKLPALKLHEVFTEDDVTITEEEISDSIGTLKTSSGLHDESGGDSLAGSGIDRDNDDSNDNNGPTGENISPSFAPHTPKKPLNSSGSGSAHNSRNMFHRKLHPVRKVAASSSGGGSGISNAVGGGGGGGSKTPQVINQQSVATKSLQRSYSTSRMNLKRVVKASDGFSSSSENTFADNDDEDRFAQTARGKNISSSSSSRLNDNDERFAQSARGKSSSGGLNDNEHLPKVSKAARRPASGLI